MIKIRLHRYISAEQFLIEARLTDADLIFFVSMPVLIGTPDARHDSLKGIFAKIDITFLHSPSLPVPEQVRQRHLMICGLPHNARGQLFPQSKKIGKYERPVHLQGYHHPAAAGYKIHRPL